VHEEVDVMSQILIAWAASAVILAAGSVALGWITFKKGPLGILIDNRGRMSLNHLQTVVWTLVVLSLIAGVFFGRLVAGVDDPLGFTIPTEVLGLLGISAGSALAVGTVKATKNRTAAARLASRENTDQDPFLSQVFLLEEGPYADEVVDISKFQSFVFTIVLVVAYVALAIHTIVQAKTAANVTTLPALSGTFLVLLGISYAGYVGGKIPNQSSGADQQRQPASPVAGLAQGNGDQSGAPTPSLLPPAQQES
jgi:hypothetical protein